MILRRAVQNTINPSVAVEPTILSLPELVAAQGLSTASGQSVTPEKAKTIATAYRCGNIISDDIAAMPLQTFVSQQPGQMVRLQPDGIMRNLPWLLEIQPNRWMSPFIFKKTLIQWLLFWGNGYVWSPPIWPREMFVLRSDFTFPVFDRDGSLWYATTFPNGMADYLPAEEVMQVMINSYDGFVGRSVITYAKESLGRQLGAYGTQSQFYQSGLKASAIMQVNGELNKDARKKLKEEYARSFADAYGLAVIDSKIAQVTPITMNAGDMQFLEQMQLTDTDIANFFGMPLYKLNMGKQSYESNSANDLEYLKTTLNPYLVQVEMGGRIKLIPTAEQGTTYLRFNRDAILSTDSKTRGEYLNASIQNGRMTPNEARAVEDLPGYGPVGDKHYMPSNIAAID